MWTRLCETRAGIMAARQRCEKEMHRLKKYRDYFRGILGNVDVLVIRDDRNGARYRDKTLEKRDRDREKERGREI